MSKSQPFQKPTEVELMNPTASFRQARDGNFYWVKFQIDRELWEAFEAPKPGMRLRGVLWEAEDDESDAEAAEDAKAAPASPQAHAGAKETRAKKEAKPKGPYGQFYKLIFGTLHLDFNLDVWQVLGANDAKDAKEKLRETFKVSSMSFVRPKEFIAWLEEKNLQALVTSANRFLVEYESQLATEDA